MSCNTGRIGRQVDGLQEQIYCLDQEFKAREKCEAMKTVLAKEEIQEMRQKNLKLLNENDSLWKAVGREKKELQDEKDRSSYLLRKLQAQIDVVHKETECLVHLSRP